MTQENSRRVNCPRIVIATAQRSPHIRRPPIFWRSVIVIEKNRQPTYQVKMQKSKDFSLYD